MLPDPYAAEYSTDGVMASAAGLTGSLNKVTELTHGTVAIKTATVVEANVTFVGTPTAKGAKDSVTLAGVTDKAGYVVCWV